ncbi:MAG: beta-propeller fold lactonase family protein [Terriglobales bacterium]
MSKKSGGIFAFLGLVGLSVFLLSCGTKVSRSSGLLFVVSQGSNQVSSYAIDQNTGNLSYLKTGASTCAATACGFPLNILLDPTNATTFVLNQGVPSSGVVPSIYAYTVNSDGTLTGVGDVTSTLNVFAPGDMAVAMTRDAGGKFLFVITQGFTPAPTGCDATPAPTGCPLLYVFATQPGSTSLTLTGNDCPGTNTPCPKPLSRVPTSVASSITVTVPDPNPPNAPLTGPLLYVTGNKDVVGSNDNTVSEYIVDQSSGTATEMTGSPYVTGAAPSAVLAVDTNPAGGNTGGLFVYVTNQSIDNNVSVFQVCIVQNANCTLQNVQDATMSAVGSPVSVGQAPVALAGDPTNNFLYVACETSNQVYAFRISTATGVLSRLNPAFLSTGSFPVAMAMHPTGIFLYLYVSNNASSNLSGFTVNTTSGQLGNPITVISLGQPAGLVAK